MDAAYLLDLIRLVARTGCGPMTGADRVELAYLRRLLDEEASLFALVRSTLGYVLLDRAGLAALRRHLPAGVRYLNVGHFNLSRVTFAGVRQIPQAQIVVLLHDIIPLDHPEYAAKGMERSFRRRLSAIGQAADLVIHATAAGGTLVEGHLARSGRVPPGVVAPLRVEAPLPAAPKQALSRPYFVVLGTIEPRKNHALLLDLWEDLQRSPPTSGVPDLLILGRRGWRNEAVFARLDALPKAGPVREMSGLNDAEVAQRLAGAAGFLFPSHAEGYGLPPLEVVALGVPVLCQPLPVLREVLGDYAVYLDGADRYRWYAEIVPLADAVESFDKEPRIGQGDFALPSWAQHFKQVLSLMR